MSEKEVVISDELPEPKGPYSPAIRAGGFVFVSGQGPIDPATNRGRSAPAPSPSDAIARRAQAAAATLISRTKSTRP